MREPDCIDAVIPWVDGADSAHIERRSAYLKASAGNVADEVTHNRRWSNTNELSICLRSIEAHAKWIRKVWIITDGQEPDLSGLPQSFLGKIHVVDHRHIFRGFEIYLPTFNSLSIGTMAWRIEGLADKFLYFNDDTFLLNKVNAADFFPEDLPILRGRWESVDEDTYLSKIYRSAKINGARLMGFGPDRFFSLAHAVMAMDRCLLADLFAANSTMLEKNLEARFRDDAQFSVSSLFAHYAIKERKCVIAKKKDWKTYSSEWCARSNLLQLVWSVLIKKLGGMKIICINDLGGIGSSLFSSSALITLCISPMTSLKNVLIRN